MGNRTRGILTLLCLIAVMVGMGLLSYYGIGENGIFSYRNIKQGLDLKGGVYIVYEAENPQGDDMKVAESRLRNRLDSRNYLEATVSIQGQDRLRVEIPDVEDADSIVEEIGATGQLLFVDEDDNIIIQGSDISDAQYQMYNETEGTVQVRRPGVSITFNREGQEKFSEGTAMNVGRRIMIVLDDVVISDPIVNQRIDSNTASITGSFTVEEADNLAALIKSGALPTPLSVVEVNKVGAQLGSEALAGSLKAGVVGTILILLFMLFLYRISGLAADIALIFFILTQLLVLSVFGVTLTLPGIAGIILTIGMAVDANVIIFERMKEELNAGKSLRTSIETGFSRAWPAILDGSVTTVMIACILFFLGTGPIKGFAQTLFLGVVISFFTAILITRLIVNSFYRIGITNRKLYSATKEDAK